ncbi:hypothetical protein BKA70DRAFT_502546 [Coprinopsis sp. MPI-PUGE-AT-0042]|nr:hypothetical protein BKA70DRAFT_502546 [Coprinopsis sp. MPI-PUGE-AT-0042]
MSLPPGLEGKWVHHVSGGGEGTEWRSYDTKKYYNTSVVVQGDKKRGWGLEKWNGFGGKVEPNETPLAAAKRELKEEAGIDADLVHAGTLLFLTSSVEWAFHIDIYRADTFVGEVTESEEMKPQWFSIDPSSASSEYPPIPYDKMWETDGCWIPLLLAKKKFAGRADFVGEKDQSKPYKWWYGVLEE